MAMDGVIGHIMVAGEVGVIQSMVAIMVAIHSIQVMGMVIGLVGEKKSMVSFHKGHLSTVSQRDFHPNSDVSDDFFSQPKRAHEGFAEALRQPGLSFENGV